MIYKYDKENLKYVKVSWITLSLKIFAAVALLMFIMSLTVRSDVKEDVSEEEIMIVMAHVNKFSEEKFINKLKSLNFKYPQIVYAQAKLETANFTSTIFMENNNLFGMKEAKRRTTTVKGTQFGHGYYESWIESLYDYAFYYERYLSSVKSEEQYYAFLSKFYAEDPNYVNKLRSMISKEKLTEKFE